MVSPPQFSVEWLVWVWRGHAGRGRRRRPRAGLWKSDGEVRSLSSRLGATQWIQGTGSDTGRRMAPAGYGTDLAANFEDDKNKKIENFEKKIGLRRFVNDCDKVDMWFLMVWRLKLAHRYEEVFRRVRLCECVIGGVSEREQCEQLNIFPKNVKNFCFIKKVNLWNDLSCCKNIFEAYSITQILEDVFCRNNVCFVIRIVFAWR